MQVKPLTSVASGFLQHPCAARSPLGRQTASGARDPVRSDPHLTCADAETIKLEKHHEEVTKVKNVATIELGKWEVSVAHALQRATYNARAYNVRFIELCASVDFAVRTLASHASRPQLQFDKQAQH